VGFVPLLTILVSIPLLGVLPSRVQLLGVLGGMACLAAIAQDSLRHAMPPLDLALALLIPSPTPAPTPT